MEHRQPTAAGLNWAITAPTQARARIPRTSPAVSKGDADQRPTAQYRQSCVGQGARQAWLGSRQVMGDIAEDPLVCG